MDSKQSILENPQGTREEIMQATYRALCEHGYADLTIKRISSHFEKSEALLYKHYESKDELLLDFLSFMLMEYERKIPADFEDDPAAHLDAILDRVLAVELPTNQSEFESAMVALRAQAAHDERYYEQFTEHDQFFQQRLYEIIQAGVADGTFREVAPKEVVLFVYTIIEGVRTLRATSGVHDVKPIRTGLDAYLDAILYSPK